ncbi:MAG TPA: ribokinase [Candidatus Saccharimonadales bacterium]|nr:ribokinase [Candidatus Saccharimonadales bacterium]
MISSCGCSVCRPRGETVGGGRFERHHGGKGANQAVAAARLGAPVEFVGAIGADDLGEAAVAALRDDGVGTGCVRVLHDQSTGVAAILVDGRGENVIAVAPGANAGLTAVMVTDALESLGLSGTDVVLVSHEIPADAVRAALALARKVGARSIFDPAPADGLVRGIFGLADLVTPNRSELAALAVAEAIRIGRPSPAGNSFERQARSLLETNAEGPGPRLGIVVTLGPAGVLLVAREGARFRSVAIPAVRIAVVDATGAGDAFNGALAEGMVTGRPLEVATRRAVMAAGLATMRSGARDGMPTAAELERALAV